MQKKILIPLISGFLFSGTALYFAFRNVPISDLLAYMQTINYMWILPSLLLISICFGFRVLRWQIILASSHTVGFWAAFHPLMIGFMLNCVLPARLGELARPAILYKNNHVPLTTGIATVVTERLFDLVLLVVMLGFVLAFVRIDPNFSHTFGEIELNKDTLETIAHGMVNICIILIIGVLMVSLDRSRQYITRMLAKLPTLLFFTNPRVKAHTQTIVIDRLISITENIASGFKLVKQPQRLFICSIYSLAVWVSGALSYYMMALGCPGIGLSLAEIAAYMIIICFFIALPSVPGYWGLWEAGGIFALYIFGISNEEASRGYTLINHAVQVIPVMIVGLVSAIIAGVNILQLKYNEE